MGDKNEERLHEDTTEVKNDTSKWINRICWKYFDSIEEAIQVVIREIDSENSTCKIVPHELVMDPSRRSRDGIPPVEWVTFEEVEILLASGRSAEEAGEAAKNGICQLCYRANDYKSFATCTRCFSYWHISCIHLKEVPKGDWYCRDCLSATDILGEFI